MVALVTTGVCWTKTAYNPSPQQETHRRSHETETTRLPGHGPQCWLVLVVHRFRKFEPDIAHVALPHLRVPVQTAADRSRAASGEVAGSESRSGSLVKMAAMTLDTVSPSKSFEPVASPSRHEARSQTPARRSIFFAVSLIRAHIGHPAERIAPFPASCWVSVAKRTNLESPRSC